MSAAKHFSRLTAAREQELLQAVRLLGQWLDDLMLSGLIRLQADSEKLNEISSRMVDAGLPGVARRLRLWPEKIRDASDWTDFVLMQISELYLFVRSFERLDQLQDAEKEDLLNVAGVVFKKTDFTDQLILMDEWLCLGQVKEKEEKLIVIRSWFYGLQSKRFALFLEYQFNRFVKTKPVYTGRVYRSSVQFYPSAYPQRIRDIQTDLVTQLKDGTLSGLNVREALDHFCKVVERNPFIRQQIYLIADAQFYSEGERWYVADRKGEGILLTNPEPEIPRILSYCSGPDTLLAGEYGSGSMRILSAILDRTVISIT
ncbi:MAG TPA: hypothetical protein VFX48_06640 [Saprospiraceae bacterium]|nr:hypothetical protein [Saprospiraceae bacterium]